MNNNDKISFSIDWLTSTFDWIQFDDFKSPYGSLARQKYEEGREKLQDLYRLLTFPEFDERTEEKKKFGEYKNSIVLGEFIKFFFNGCKNGKGLRHSKFEIPGNGCRDFINRGGNWFDLFRHLYTGQNIVHNKPTRIDAAIDVKTTKYFTFEKLLDWLYVRGLYSSPSRKININGSKEKINDELNPCGNTIYIGSESSDVYICIYDKKLERINAGDDTPMLDECWYRIEMRFRGDHAIWFAENFIKSESRNDYSFIMDALYKYLDIKNDVQNDKALRNRTTADWWKDFLSDATKAKFEKFVPNPITLKTKQNYVEVNAGMSITQVLYSFDKPIQSLDYIYNLFDLKSSEMENKELIQVNKFREEKGLKPFKDFDELLDYKEKLKFILERIANE